MTEETTSSEADAEAEKPAREILVGYQWGDDMSFIGPYEFERNLDQMAIHLPPRTTLKAPPAGLVAGKEAAFDVALDDWVVRDEDLSWLDPETRAKLLAGQEAP